MNGNKVRATILAISVVQMGTSAISPILADIAAAFPQAGSFVVQFLMTFPSLLVIVCSLLAASLTRYVPKKWIAALGCGLFSLSGVLSWLFHGALSLLFLWGAVMGIGIGLVVPMATSLVSDCFSGAEQQTVMGWQSSAANVGAMLMTFLGGLLAAVHWSCNYLVYLIAVPGLVLAAVCLPRTVGRQGSEQTPNGGVGYFTLLQRWPVLAGCLLAAAVTMLFNIVPTNLSMYVTEAGIGSAAQAGTATSLLLLSGTLGGIFYGALSKRLGRYVMAFGFCMLAMGQLVCSAAPNMAVVYLGCLLCGCSISTVMPRAMLEMAEQSGGNPAATAALAMSASNLGGFCSPAITMAARQLSGSGSVSARFVLGAACALLVAVLVVLMVRREARQSV